jgi:serine/threonine-protein kinase ATR
MQVRSARQALLQPLAAASMESYTRAYPLLVKLHMLRELEDCHPVLASAAATPKSVDLSKQSAAGPSHSGGGQHSATVVAGMVEATQDWEDRLKITQPSLWAREPILALRR